LEFFIEENMYVLNEGDSIAFKASIPHRWKNNSSHHTKVLWVVSPPPNV
jgi:quercetin dioxygenase-like cupin family protein